MLNDNPIVNYLNIHSHFFNVLSNYAAFSKQVCLNTLSVDEIYHLASPASPPHYMYNPIKTIKTNTIGTINMLGK